MSISLPDVVQEWTANVAPFVAAMGLIIEAAGAVADAVEADMARAQLAIDSLHGTDIKIGVDTSGLGGLGAAAGLGGLGTQMDDVVTHAAAMDASLDEVKGTLGSMAADAVADSAVMVAAVGRVGDAVDGLALRTAAANTAIGASAAGAWAPTIGWIRLTGTALHWIVAGSAEFLAVAVPAAIALGAGMAVAAQGAQNAYIHFTSLYAATESTANAMHQTVGTVLGLGHALQTAQDAANPGVYEILGSAINDAKQGFSSLAGVGLQVVHMFDEFAARVTVDLKDGMGQQIQGLLAGMVTDLRLFGEVFANLGHALLNFASDMPGLAHFLLMTAEGLSSVVEEASRFGVLITFAMGLEEMYRWGGLFVGILARITGGLSTMNAIAGGGGFIVRFGAAIQAVVGQLGLGVGALGRWLVAAGDAQGVTGALGNSMKGLGQDMVNFTYASPKMVAGIAGIVGAMAGLMIMSSHLKDNMQQLAANALTAVQTASDAQFVNVASAQYAKLSTSVQQVSASFGHMSLGAQEAGAVASSSWAQWNPLIAGLGGAGRLTAGFGQELSNLGAGFAKMPTPISGAVGAVLSFFGAFAPAAKASADLTALHAAESGVSATAQTFGSNLGYLGGQFHTTAVGALALASAAGVNLTQGLLKGTEQGQIAVQMINNLKAGLGAMQAPASEVGADMSAVGVQSQLAASKVATVNQAMDAFIAGTTGGMDTVMQFNAALRAMGKDTVAGSQSLTGQISSISSSAAKLGYTLSGIGPHAQQSWQQFDAALQQGNTVLDTFRTGMAEGVVTQQQYTREIQAVGGSMLPFAAHSKTALAMVSQLAQEMGLPATSNLKTLASDFGITGKAAQNMATTGMEQAVARMANLNTIARNLSVTIGTQLDSAMASAIVKASGMAAAYQKWANDVKNNAPAATLKGDLGGIAKAQDFVNTAEQTATKLLNTSKVAATGYGGSLRDAAGNLDDFTSKARDAHAALGDVIARASQAAQNTQGFGQQAHTAADSAQGLASQASTATTQVRNLGAAAGITQGHLGDVNNEIRTAATAAGNSAGPLGTMIGNIQRVGSDAMTAAGQVHALATAISGLQSKSITLTTNMVTVTSTVHRQHGGPVWPGIPAIVGEAGREMFMPSQPGYILPHNETERFLNSPGGRSGGGTGDGGGGTGGGPIHVHNVIHVQAAVDEGVLFEVTKKQTAIYGVRNGTAQQGRLAPGSL